MPLAVEAQRAVAMARLGLLAFGTASDPGLRPLREGLRELGYIEGEHLTVEYPYAEARAARLPDLARELTDLKPLVGGLARPGGNPSLLARADQVIE
jgi:hypothetical protein